MFNNNFLVTVEGREIPLKRSQIGEENIVSLPANRMSLISAHKSYTARLTDVDVAKKRVFIEMEGKVYEVDIMNELDMQLKTMGFNNISAKQLKEIKAPMPGMVLEVIATEGEQLEAGARLLVLEAMKMENVISLPAASTIKRVLIKKGEAVQKNQVLMELDNG